MLRAASADSDDDDDSEDAEPLEKELVEARSPAASTILSDVPDTDGTNPAADPEGRDCSGAEKSKSRAWRFGARCSNATTVPVTRLTCSSRCTKEHVV